MIGKAVLLIGMILLPGCLVVTCGGSSNMDEREANPQQARRDRRELLDPAESGVRRRG